MREIPIRNRSGLVIAHAKVDDERYVWAMGYAWSLSGGYATRGTTEGGRAHPIRRSYSMHREILGLVHGDPREGDHVNGDTLDNRRFNLRVASRAENKQNSYANRGGTSRHRGVSWDTRRGKWVSRAKLAGVTYHLGYFADEDEAGGVAAEWRRDHMPFSAEAAA